MAKLLKYFIFILGVILISTCTHEKDIPVDCGDAQTIAEMKPWVLFKPGTYWIYEEETSGERDTVTVTEYFDGVSSGGFAAFGCLMYSSYDGFYYDYAFNDSYSGISPNGCAARKVFCSKYKPGNYYGGDNVFVFPLEIGKMGALTWGGGDYGYFDIVSYPIGIQIEDVWYFPCLTYFTQHAVQHSWNPAYYSLCKNQGIIKKEIPAENKVWNLTESQIIQ